MRLITEQFNDLEILTEQTASGKILYLEGPMAMAEQKNRNGRIYPKAVLEKAVDKYNNEYVKEHRALGELNHPERPFADPAVAAMFIEKLEWQGNAVIGKARILNNPYGNQIKSLIEAGFKGGVSTRGLGNVVESTNGKMVNEYLLTAIDYVDKPSAQIAYPNAIFENASEWVMENGIWVEKQNFDKIGELFMEKFEELMFNLKKGKING